MEAWIDTGFTSELVVPSGVIASLGLPPAQKLTAVLADGSSVEMATYLGRIDWFGQTVNVEVIAGDGNDVLLGVGLLLGHRLHIDYAANTVTLT